MNFASFSHDLVRHRPRRSAGLIAVELVDSTQVLGRRLVDEYLRDGARAPEIEIVAWCQSAGRGRHGRGWSSPPGCGVYATLIRWKSVRLQLLPLQTAVALCDSINVYLGGKCSLKWPNDLVIDGRKLGGLLIDAVTFGDGSPVAIISFGVNHGGDPAAFGGPRATSVARETPSGWVPPLPGLVLELIDALDRELAEETTAAQVSERYEERSSHAVGDLLRCRLGKEGDPVEGRFLGFDEHGFLRLDVQGEEQLLSAGEVLGRG